VTEIAIADRKSVMMNVPIKSNHVQSTSVHFRHQKSARVHGTNGAHAMQSAEQEPDHVIVNVSVVPQDVQDAMRTCPKKKSVKAMMR
jgi:hypothetical protein